MALPIPNECTTLMILSGYCGLILRRVLAASHRDSYFVLRVTSRSPPPKLNGAAIRKAVGPFDCLSVVGANQRFGANEMSVVIDRVSSTTP